MPHAQEVQRRIHPVEIGKRHFPRGVALQIVPEDRPSRLPAETHFVQLLRSHMGEVEARSNGVFSEAGIVLQPADALFRHREQQFAVARDARRRVMHLRIVNPSVSILRQSLREFPGTRHGMSCAQSCKNDSNPREYQSRILALVAPDFAGAGRSRPLQFQSVLRQDSA